MTRFKTLQNSYRRQRGHVLVFAVAMLLAVAMMLMLVFNTGQLTASKMRLTNTADAVAYSVATVEARDLNFLAYTNRAIVANEAAIGQTLSYANFFNFLDVSLHGIEVAVSAFLDLLFPIPVVGEVALAVQEALSPIWKAAGSATALAVKTLIPLLGKGLVMGSGFLEEALGAAQGLAQVGMADELGETFYKVLKANDPDLDLGSVVSVGSVAAAAKSMSEFPLFLNVYQRPADSQETKKAESDQGKNFSRLTKLFEDARDDFTKRRVLWDVNLDTQCQNSADPNCSGPNAAQKFISGAFDFVKTLFSWLPVTIEPEFHGGTDYGYLKGDTTGHNYGWQAVDGLAIVISLNLKWLSWLIPGVPDSVSLDAPVGGVSFMQTGSDKWDSFEGELAEAANPLERNKLANNLIRYGGQKEKDETVAFWPPNKYMNRRLNREVNGALNRLWDTASLDFAGALSDVCQPIPLVCESRLGLGEKYVLDNHSWVNPAYVDLRTIKKLVPFGKPNDDAIDLIDQMEVDFPLLQKPDPDSDNGPTILVPLNKKLSLIHTANTMGLGADRAKMSDFNTLNAIGKAQVYFKRPADRWMRKDLLIEHRSLFNPYWNARLVRPTFTERTAFLALWGVSN